MYQDQGMVFGFWLGENEKSSRDPDLPCCSGEESTLSSVNLMELEKPDKPKYPKDLTNRAQKYYCRCGKLFDITARSHWYPGSRWNGKACVPCIAAIGDYHKKSSAYSIPAISEEIAQRRQQKRQELEDKLPWWYKKLRGLVEEKEPPPVTTTSFGPYR